MNLRRRKQPAAVREQILAAARQVLAEDGAAALTFDSVLARTDLSKGGIQYHFRTKQALLDGLFHHLMETFQRVLEEELQLQPAGPQRRIRAYINVVCRSAESLCDAREAIAILMADPKYLRSNDEALQSYFSPDALPADLLTTCRMAVDGLWHAQVLYGEPQREVIERVRSCLLRLLDAELPASRLRR